MRSPGATACTKRSRGSGGLSCGTTARRDWRAASAALRRQRSARPSAARAWPACTRSHSSGTSRPTPSSVAFSMTMSLRLPGAGAKARVMGRGVRAGGCSSSRTRTRAAEASARTTSAMNSEPEPVKRRTCRPAPIRSTVTMCRLCSGARATVSPTRHSAGARKRRRREGSIMRERIAGERGKGNGVPRCSLLVVRQGKGSDKEGSTARWRGRSIRNPQPEIRNGSALVDTPRRVATI